MGDRYQPDYRRGDVRPRDDYYDRPDRYREPNYPDERPRGGGGGYTFRGAAEREAPHHRPQREEEQFHFRAPASGAPRFPPDDRHAAPQPQQSRPRREDPRRRQDRRPPPGPRNGATTGYRGRGGFRPRPAHNRDILNKTGRETTPELLDGMYIDGEARFREVDSSSEESSDEASDDEVIDLTRDSDEDTEAPRKRTKVKAQPETAAPKWSNPDPYTVLPPPETLGAPKKDIVQVIRKAKVDGVPKADGQNAVKENADFISLNFDDDFEDGMVSDDSVAPANTWASVNVPKAPSGFSHRDEFHAKHLSTQPTPQVQSTSSHTANSKLRSMPPAATAGGPPSPPPGFVMPTDEELMAQYAGGGKSKKRKHDDITSREDRDIVEEWRANHTDATPWCTMDHSRTANPGLRLHKEICDFFEFVRPYEYEEAVRQALIKRIEKATRQAYIHGAKDVEVKCFGSFAAGLYLPTADMDLVAVSPGYLHSGRKSFCQTSSPMHKLSNYLQNAGIATPGGIAVVAKARVPIIKFSDKSSGIKVDISFENDSGLLANETFQSWKAQYPAMPVIVVLIKQLLAMRELNEVFSGGIGGFTIICLVVSMMQLMPELQSGSMDPQQHHGDLLLNFLDLYGNKFDIRATGITMNPPGYFDKINSPQVKQNPNRLTIIDPNNANNDISGGSSKIDDVFDCFRHAHSQLQRRLAQVHQGRNVMGSILGCVWGGNYTSFIHQREKLSLLHRGYAVSPPPPPAPKPAPKAKDKGKKQAAKQTWKQAQPFVAAQHIALPHKPVAQTQQPRAVAPTQPPRGHARAYPLPPKPTAQLQQTPAQNGYADFSVAPNAYSPY
ncbi:hypothetical protein LTR36_008223 [Oleoguttula mirabilis]|uniref:polynucleotide adenylyltransferase n=1 Tax=Oleoguttula mirabilis TaxID=1507867 RepID=A0AAV9J8A8_9PEZI|nr:hypothetical protein LTR36_008223 [Oleoguttula mirabilis]